MAVCPLCDQRKGKRACPAKRTVICAPCCGEKRIVEIPCPPDCTYLGQGQENEILRFAQDYIQHQDPRKAMRWIQVMERLEPLVGMIERAIAVSPIPKLDDSEVLTALDCARRTFESEAKGIIYETMPESPTLQSLVRDIVDVPREIIREIEEKQRSLELGADSSLPLGPAEIAECFEVMTDRCLYHVENRLFAGSYVTHLRRTHPLRPGEEGAGSSRIVLA